MKKKLLLQKAKKQDLKEIDKFYINFLTKEHSDLVSEEDQIKFTEEYKKAPYLLNYLKNSKYDFYVARENKKIVGLLVTNYFDSPTSIFAIIATLDDHVKKLFIQLIQNLYVGIKDIWIDVYVDNKKEFNLYSTLGFEIWEKSAAPVGTATLEVYLMIKKLT